MTEHTQLESMDPLNGAGFVAYCESTSQQRVSISN